MPANGNSAIPAGHSQVRLHFLTALQLGLRRADEVLALVRSCNDRNEAIVAVQALLGLDRNQARAVLDLQWDRLTVHSIEQIETELTELRRNIGEDHELRS